MATSVDKNVYDVKPVEYTSNQAPLQGRMHTHPETPYRFTNDELRVLRQCNRDGFYQRSLPLATIFGVGAYLGVKSGYFKGNPRWGPAPKVAVGVIAGYFIGKFSYQTKCAERLMQLPNSQIGEMLRQRKKMGGINETLGMDPGFGAAVLAPPFETSTTDMAPLQDIDTDRPLNDGLDDIYRPTLDTPSLDEDTLPPRSDPNPTTTYEELRRKNREEYEQKKTKPYRGVTHPEDVPTMIRQRSNASEPSPSPPASWSKEKNKYGDVWDD